jgi:hypothetical protein
MNQSIEQRIIAYVSLGMSILAWVLKGCSVKVQPDYFVVPAMLVGLIALKSPLRGMVFISWALGLLMLAVNHIKMHWVSQLITEVSHVYPYKEMVTMVKTGAMGLLALIFVCYIIPVFILRPLLRANDGRIQKRMMREWHRRP